MSEESHNRSTSRRAGELSLLAPVWSSLIVVSVAFAVFHPALFAPSDEDSPNDTPERNLFESIRSPSPYEPVFKETHDPLFPLTLSDKFGFAFAGVGLMLAAAGGIGGGGILVPIYILILRFSPKHAIPLSNVTIFGGSVANVILNSWKRHPLADRPLVDWDLILVMEPLTIGGALVGAMFEKILPELLVTVMLVVLLSVTAQNSLKKAFKLYEKETEDLKAQSKSEQERLPLKTEDYGASEDKNSPIPQLLDEEEASVRSMKAQMDLDALLEEERRTPISNLMVLILLFIVVLVVNLLKGGSGFPSLLGIQCGSVGFWSTNALMLGWIVGMSLYARQILLKKHRRKRDCGYPYVEGDIEWNERATLVFPAICCGAGFFAGLFGVGGGIVKGPLMLAMGVHPSVSSATSACMIFFTSLTATTSFIVFGLLAFDYAIICVSFGFLSTLVGQLATSYLIHKMKRSSYIAFSIGGVVLLSAFLMTIESIIGMVHGETHKSGGMCGMGD